MRCIKLNWILMLLFMGLLLQSCSKDESLEDSIENIADNDDLSFGFDDGDIPAAGGGGQNGGGPNGGGPNGGDPNGGGPNNDRPNSNVNNIDNDVVYEWTNLMLELERYAGGMRPNASARAFAYIYLASYETAVPGIPNQISNVQNLNGLRINENQLPGMINWEVALNSCFEVVMNHFIYNLPNEQRSKIRRLANRLSNEYADDLSNQLVENSEEWGEYVANRVIEYSQTDEAAEAQILQPQPTSYEPPTGEGYWTYSADEERALFPYWGSVRTFVIAPDQTSTRAPIEYSENPNSPYFAEMMECYTDNNTAKAEDNEQLWIAEFWSDDVENVMFSPPARQYSISNQLIDERDLNLAQTLTMYLKLGFSLNDAAVATWKYKYDYMVMRPNVYIHEFIDPAFQTNLYRLVYWPNPSFPGYPSGHSTFASAAAGVFKDYFGNSINFTDRSHEGRTEFRGTPRRFNSFDEMAEENAFSRIPLGVHMRMDCAEGLRLGYEISDAINDLNLAGGPGDIAEN